MSISPIFFQIASNLAASETRTSEAFEASEETADFQVPESPSSPMEELVDVQTQKDQTLQQIWPVLLDIIHGIIDGVPDRETIPLPINNAPADVLRDWLENPESKEILEQITEIALSEMDLIIFPEELKKLTQLTYLDLSNNKIKTIPADAFDGLELIEELFLSQNEIIELPETVFDPLVNLSLLDLKENRIRTLKPNIFQRLTSLSSIHLNGNQIETLPSNLFSETRSLVNLFLHRNHLRFLSDAFFRNLVSLTQIALEENLFWVPANGFFRLIPSLERITLSAEVMDWAGRPSRETVRYTREMFEKP